MTRKTLLVIAAITLVGMLSLAAKAEDAHQQNREERGHWVGAWSSAMHSPLPFPGMPPPQQFDNQTIRMVVRPTIGGSRLRITFSNAYGASPLEIGAAHVALVDNGSAIKPASDRTLTFAGQRSVTIPPGAPFVSDPVNLSISPLKELAVTIYLPRKTVMLTTHYWGQHASYISGPGNLADELRLESATEKPIWYALSEVQVWSARPAAALVAFGDSITDGSGAKQGDYADWPDVLAKRLSNSQIKNLAVLNEGIGGNRILHDGAGVNALARFDRDVLAQPGVSALIILEGINDIGWPHEKPRPSQDGSLPAQGPYADEQVTAADLIAGLQQMVARAHAHGIRVFGATLTPYEGAAYYTPDGEMIRQAVNRWIRQSGAFDGVIDFDAVVRDPDHPSRFRQDYQSGDQLHPSEAGYKAMAAAINLKALQTSPR